MTWLTKTCLPIQCTVQLPSIYPERRKFSKLCHGRRIFLIKIKVAVLIFFFFFFRLFPSIRGGHSVSYFYKPSYFQCPSPLHQLSPYLLSQHLQIFSLVSLFSSFPVTPFPSSFFLHTFGSPHDMSIPHSLPSLIFIPNHFTLTVPLMYSFLILSFLVIPIANLNIFISATSISFTCFFVTATVSSPCTIAGLTTELYSFPFTLAGNLLSQITPDTFLHPFHPACTLFFTSLSQLQLSCIVDPKYLNFFTLDTFVGLSSIFIASSSFPPFMHRYLVFGLLTFIPLLFDAYLQHSSLCFTFFLVSSQITISSANSIVHGNSLLTSFISLFMITTNRNRLNADPWCSPTLILKLSVVLAAHLTTVLLSSYTSCTSHTYFSAIPDFLIQYHSSSRGTLS